MKTEYTSGPVQLHQDPKDCHRWSLLREDQWGAVHVATVSIINTTPKATDANAHRLAGLWNAALGLELPEDVPPGCLADLVAAAREVRDVKGRFNTEQATRKLLDALARLAPGAPEGREPVSPPEVPDAVRAAFAEVWRHLPAVCHMAFDDGLEGRFLWEFSTAENDKPELPFMLDVTPVIAAHTWLKNNGGFPQSFELSNPDN